MFTEFPLFSTPLIVLVEVLKCAEPKDIVSLSLCSQKSHSIVKNFWKLPENAQLRMWDAGWSKKLFLGNDSDPIIGIEKEDRYPTHGTKHSCFVKIVSSKQIRCHVNILGHLDTYWKNDRIGFKAVTNYICDLFKTHVTNVTICVADGFWMFDWIKQRQIEAVNEVYAKIRKEVCGEKYSKLLRLTPTNSLSVYVTPPADFDFPGNLPSVKHLTIRNGTWLKIEHLLSLNSETVFISNSKLTNANINVFIKHWLNGGFPGLKFIETGVDGRTNHDQIYEDIEEQLVEVEEERTYIWKTGKKAIQTNRVTITATKQPYDIRRESDGIVCTCFRYQDAFAMVVWPDYDGNSV